MWFFRQSRGVSHATTTSLPLFAGEMVAARPLAEVVSFCQRVPDLWLTACTNASHTCLPRAVLNSSMVRSVFVRHGGKLMSLPNIHRQLLLLAQLLPGRQGAVLGAHALCCGAESVAVDACGCGGGFIGRVYSVCSSHPVFWGSRWAQMPLA